MRKRLETNSGEKNREQLETRLNINNGPIKNK